MVIDFSKTEQYRKNNHIEAKKLLSELIAEEIVVTEGGNRNRIYKLKS